MVSKNDDVISELPLGFTGGWKWPDDTFDDLLDLMPFSEFREQ
jgi:hypothetical protein